MAVLPDPSLSQAVLVGVSAYRFMPPIPAASNNIRMLGAKLMDPAIWGLPESNCHIVENPATIDTVLERVHDAARVAGEALVFYFAGHGLMDQNSDLCLALVDSSVDRLHRTVRFAEIRREIVNTARKCPAKVVILDCCFSRKAMEGFLAETHQLADHAVVDGAYLMTATDETGLAKVGVPHTAFTAALLHTLANGIADGPDLLDMESLS